MRCSYLGLLAFMAMTAFSCPAIADSTFDVAVNVTDLGPEVQRIAVECLTCVGDCPTLPVHYGRTANSDRVIRHGGSYSPDFSPRAPRNFNGTITVTADQAVPGVRNDTRIATHYSCAMYLFGQDAGQPADDLPSDKSTYQWARPLPNRPFVPELRGRLP